MMNCHGHGKAHAPPASAGPGPFPGGQMTLPGES